ncbi:urate oxidase [Naegleria gruberi]|uniref:factor independent urate hydroxylase n=1 Tax=Naegleria gruberi TaxID=5762 RepID=D2VL29_NAEGR|nr:urate oxidase [Naegleria gruberi]EFC42465.1 urate oxidase [Naegleria gruberi]|eukprot:XP_002675209.1 urate oxidase [Naegleria gruberi]
MLKIPQPQQEYNNQGVALEQHPPNNRTNSLSSQNVGIKFLQTSNKTLVETKIQVSLESLVKLDDNTVKNILYEMANSNLSIENSSIENFALITSKHFFREFDNINLVKLDVEQSNWQQIENNKAGHFQAECLRFVRLADPRNGEISLCSGVKSLSVPKKSEVSEFLKSNSIKMDVFWKISSSGIEEHTRSLVNDRQSVIDFNETYDKVRESIWNGVKDIQNIDLKDQCNNVLGDVPIIKCVFISIPNCGQKMDAFASRHQSVTQQFSFHGRPANNIFLNHFHRMNRDFYASKL